MKWNAIQRILTTASAKTTSSIQETFRPLNRVQIQKLYKNFNLRLLIY